MEISIFVVQVLKVSNLTNKNNFHPLEVVNHISETQLHVSENLNCAIKSLYCHCFFYINICINKYQSDDQHVCNSVNNLK